MRTWAAKSASIDGADSTDLTDEEEGVKDTTRSSRKRRQGSDAFKYLEAKGAADVEIRKEEMVLRQKEVALQQKRQELFESQIQHQQE